jgi:hypothetical protein
MTVPFEDMTVPFEDMIVPFEDMLKNEDRRGKVSARTGF